MDLSRAGISLSDAFLNHVSTLAEVSDVVVSITFESVLAWADVHTNQTFHRFLCVKIHRQVGFVQNHQSRAPHQRWEVEKVPQNVMADNTCPKSKAPLLRTVESFKQPLVGRLREEPFSKQQFQEAARSEIGVHDQYRRLLLMHVEVQKIRALLVWQLHVVVRGGLKALPQSCLHCLILHTVNTPVHGTGDEIIRLRQGFCLLYENGSVS